MGNMRRVGNNLNPGIVLSKTGLSFGGSEIFLVGGDKRKAKAFRDTCVHNAFRSSLPNVYDILNISVNLRDKWVSSWN